MHYWTRATAGALLGLAVGAIGQSAGATGPAAAPPPAAQPPAAQPVASPAAAANASSNASADAAARPPRIPTTVFAARAFMSDPLLAPDGTAFATRLNVKGKEQLRIFELSGAHTNIGFAAPEHFDLLWYSWAGSKQLLVSLGHTVPWDGDEAYSTRLMLIDRATGAGRFIGGREEGLTGDDLLWTDPEGKRILLAYQRTIYDYPSVSSIDLATNTAHEVVRAREGIWHWSADEDGTVRYGYGHTDAHHWMAVYRPTASDPFRVIARQRDDREEGSDFDVFRIVQGSDEGYVYDTDEKTGLKALYKFNFATRKRGDLVFEAPGADIEAAYTTADGKAMEAAWYTDDRPRVKWWDPATQAFQDQLDTAVNAPQYNHGQPGDRMARVWTQSRDHAIKLVWVGAADDPGKFYVYQEATGRMTVLASIAEALHPAELARPAYVHYTARDGLEIHAYLTVPRGRPAKGLPLVILPHGGPFWVRDQGGYDDDVQFLANRGYVVLQPEFRGSGSYGTAFHDKGRGQWGRAMQDDIDDGMDWLVKQGLVDARRVCIVGISYGGYAALWGATRNPERYRCAASLAGVTDIGRQVKYSNHFDDDRQSREDWQSTVQGDKSFDLKTVSPLYTVSRLQVPVLVMHGDKDQRVLPKQSQLYADALKAAGKTYEYYTLPGDGHGYTTQEAAQSWYDRLDAFLAKYNPAD